VDYRCRDTQAPVDIVGRYHHYPTPCPVIIIVIINAEAYPSVVLTLNFAFLVCEVQADFDSQVIDPISGYIHCIDTTTTATLHIDIVY
jgi:hypothetical protein